MRLFNFETSHKLYSTAAQKLIAMLFPKIKYKRITPGIVSAMMNTTSYFARRGIVLINSSPTLLVNHDQVSKSTEDILLNH